MFRPLYWAIFRSKPEDGPVQGPKHVVYSIKDATASEMCLDFVTTLSFMFYILVQRGCRNSRSIEACILTSTRRPCNPVCCNNRRWCSEQVTSNSLTEQAFIFSYCDITSVKAHDKDGTSFIRGLR